MKAALSSKDIRSDQSGVNLDGSVGEIWQKVRCFCCSSAVFDAVFDAVLMQFCAVFLFLCCFDAETDELDTAQFNS